MMLILGIMIEELVNECLGKEGCKVFIEQDVETHNDDDESERSGDTGNRNEELDSENNTEEEESLDDEFSDLQ
jgi:hypothetical protein